MTVDKLAFNLLILIKERTLPQIQERNSVLIVSYIFGKKSLENAQQKHEIV